MTDAELCVLIDKESRTAIGVSDKFATDREAMWDFYRGEATGKLAPPEGDGLSSVVSKDLLDTVEWAMPALMRMFSQDGVIRFEPDHPDDEKQAEDATNYCNHLFFRKNNGFTTLHDAIKSCLVARMGVVKVWCDKGFDERTETYRGLSQQEVQAISSDPKLDVVEVVQDEEPAELMQGMPPEMAVTFTAKVKIKTPRTRIAAEGVPPEEIRIARNTRTLDDCRYIAHVSEQPISELISEGWPEDELKAAGDAYEGIAEREERHEYDGSEDFENEGDASQRKVTVTEAYIKVDYDGDGVSEYRRVRKCGTYVHENEETDDHPFALFCPILMPYKVIGLGFYDLVEDLQRIRTALTRQMLDNAYQANRPRTTVVEGQVNLDDLLNPRPGGLIRVKTLDATRTEQIPFVGPQALLMLDHFQQKQDTRTGVTEMNSALNSESLAQGNIGSQGIQSMMAAGQQRLELIARVLAETGMKRLWQLLLKNATQYTDREQQMKVNGQWMQVDPREWTGQYDMAVSVGVGNAGRQEKLQALQLIGMAQQQAFEAGVVNPENVYNLVTDLAKAAAEGQSPDRYFSPPQPKPPAPPPIELQLEQMKQQGAQQMAQFKAQSDAQLAQVKSQADIQTAQYEQQAQDAQAQRELEMQAQRDQLKMHNEMALEQFKIEKQAEIETYKAQLQHQTAIETAQISSGNGRVSEDGTVSHPLDGAVSAIQGLVESLHRPRTRKGRIIRDAEGRAVNIEMTEE